MSEQRIETGADAATGRDADPGEGQGLGGGADSLSPGGSDRPTADRTGGGTADTADSAETEGASHLLDTRARAGGTPDLSGRLSSGTDAGPAGSGPAGSGSADAGPAGSGSADSGSADAGPAGRSAVERTGEITSAPREHRREVDPGSVATEFGDRADEAPDDVARPAF